MFWSSVIASSSNIDSALDAPDVTLYTILDNEDLLQECRLGNRKLLDFLQRPDNIHAMMDLITTVPPDNVEIQTQYKYPNITCEVLTSDISFAEKIVADPSYLEKLFHFFKDTPPPLNPLLASYVCRVLSELVIRKPDQNWYSYKLNTIQFMGYLTETETNIVELLLTHIGTSSVCDFVYKLIICIDGQDTRSNLTQWLEKENFVHRLMQKMGKCDKEVHESVDRLVNELLDAFRDELSSSTQDRSSDADPFLLALKSPKTFETLLCAMFDQPEVCESSIKYGLNIAVALMGVPKKPQRPTQQKSWVSINEHHQDLVIEPEIEKLVTSRFDTLYNLLSVEPTDALLKLPYGKGKHRVGTMRLSIVKFFAHIASLRSPSFIDEIIRSEALKKVTSMFWYNEWNGFLHREVERILLNILLMPQKNAGFEYILKDLNILHNIMEAFKEPLIECGYRGHLARFCSVFMEVTSRPGFQGEVITELEKAQPDFYQEWDNFLATVIEPYLQRERILLGGVMIPHSGVPVGSQAISEEFDNLSDINSWGALKSAELGGQDDFGVFSDGDGTGKDMFDMFCSVKENGLDSGDLGEVGHEHIDSDELDDVTEWRSADTLLNDPWAFTESLPASEKSAE